VALRLEAALEEAQVLAASLDEDRALTVLAGIERDLLAHPELPQAAWLMAERHHLAGAIRRKQPGGLPDADALLESAHVLEGPRAAPFGDDGASAPAMPVALATLSVLDLDPADRLVLDGRPATQKESVRPGRHHARVLRGSSVAWSGWFDVPAEPRVDKVLGVPVRVACSAEDLRDVTPDARTPGGTSGVHCARWVGVRRGKGGLEVAWCEGARCSAYGPLLHDRPAPEPRASIPTWAAATLVGAAALGAGSLLIFTGAFERDEPPPRRVFVYRGPE